MNPSNREKEAFEYLSSFDAMNLESRITRKVLAQKQALINIRSDSNPDALVYVVEDRIYDKFVSKPDIMIFSHPLNLSLLESTHKFYVPDEPLSWIHLQGDVEYFQLSDNSIQRVNSLSHSMETSYCVHLDYVKRPSGAHLNFVYDDLV